MGQWFRSIGGESASLDSLLVNPVATLCKVTSDFAADVSTWVFNKNEEYGISGYQLTKRFPVLGDDPYLVDAAVMVIEAAVAGLAAGAIAYAGIRHYLDADAGFAGLHQWKYERRFSHDSTEKRRFGRFNKKMKTLLSRAQGSYERIAVRALIREAINAEKPYQTISRLESDIGPQMTAGEIIDAGSRYLPNGSAIKDGFHAKYDLAIYVSRTFDRPGESREQLTRGLAIGNI
ncbi:MAG: hypothetical protein ABH879_07030 [archaeon]